MTDTRGTRRPRQREIVDNYGRGPAPPPDRKRQAWERRTWREARKRAVDELIGRHGDEFALLFKATLAKVRRQQPPP
jgi:hypothetical protein